MSRVALPVASPTLDMKVDPRFGPSPYLVLVDPETMAWESLENPGWDTMGGAVARVAEALRDRKVSDAVCGEFDPNAHDALQTAGITTHRCECGTTVRGAVERLKAGELPEDFWK